MNGHTSRDDHHAHNALPFLCRLTVHADDREVLVSELDAVR